MGERTEESGREEEERVGERKRREWKRERVDTYGGFELKFLPMKTCLSMELVVMASTTSGMEASNPLLERLISRRQLVRERTLGSC